MLIWKMAYVNSAKKLLVDSLLRQLQNLERRIEFMHRLMIIID